MPYWRTENEPPWRPDWIAILSWLAILASIALIGAVAGWLLS